MLYRKMPKNGDLLSVLGFGCMRLPAKDHQIDDERATRLIRDAIDQGVNYVDTAWPYHAGQSEPLLGRALAGGYRERTKVATKLPSWLIQNRDDMDRYLDAQLAKLDTAWIDYYLVHSLAGETWDRMAQLGVAKFLDQAKADGRIRNAGFSYHGGRQDFSRVVDAYPWEFCQIQYNFLDQEHQAGTEGLQYAGAKGLGVIVMEPLRGGKLGLPTPPPEIDALWQQAARRRTPAEWALRWVWNHPETTVVLSGMNEESQLEENLAVAGAAEPLSLSEEELRLVDTVAQRYREIMKIGCTGCGYCEPCPMGVDIAAIFDVYNTRHMFGKVEEAMFLYAMRMSGVFSGRPAYASQCERCGDCLMKCPQNLAIPDLLVLVAAEFEGDGLKQREAMVRQFLGNGARL